LIGGTALYTDSPQRITEVTTRHAAIEEELMALLERWEALSQKA
jgi:ATP-binding cassette subfamily F protein uup